MADILENYAENGATNSIGSGRDAMLGRNLASNQYGPERPYGSTHTRALVDDETPTKGRGTGNDLDVDNYNAGTSIDKDGNQGYSFGSGRNKAFLLNKYDYIPENQYKAPEIESNISDIGA